MELLERREMLATFTVVTNADGGVGSLREAVVQANISAGPDQIIFSPSTNGTEFDLSLGEMLVTDPLIITGNGATHTVIDAQQASRVFNFQSGNFTLDAVTLKNGRETAENNGGGAIISSSLGLLKIQDSILVNNSTSGFHARGGAVFSSFGAVSISRSTFSGNHTSGIFAFGGALHTDTGAVTINRSSFLGNSTSGDHTQGGAFHIVNGPLSVAQSTFAENFTSGLNSRGGAIFAGFGAVNLTQSTISGNQVSGANSDGGGLMVDDALVMINSSTITGNSATRRSGGLGVNAGPGDKKLTLSNSIIAGNLAAIDPDFNAPTNPATNLEVRYSLVGRRDGNWLTQTGMTPNHDGNLIGGASDLEALDPRLGPLAINGGPTLTHGLLSDSPAFNRGSNSLSEGLIADQRGNGFSRTRFGVVDMGAFESANVDFPEGTSGADSFVLTYSNTTASGTVNITASLGGKPLADLGTFPTNLPLIIDGLGGTDSVRVVGNSASDTFTVTSSGVTVNGAKLSLTGFENRTLVGAVGDDIYRFDADSALGTWKMDETGGDLQDTVDLALTTTLPVKLNLGLATTQVVNSNFNLVLGSTSSCENAIGGSLGDSLTGNSLLNVLKGGPGNDTLNGMGANDLLRGGLNDDTYLFGVAIAAEADLVDEFFNEGTDTLSFTALSTSVKLNLGSSLIQTVHANRKLTLNSSSDIENAIGGSEADTLTGSTQANRLAGGPGIDTLNGLGGDDFLLGGLNDDLYIFGEPISFEADEVGEYANQGTDTLSFAALTTDVVLNIGSTAYQHVHYNRRLKLNTATNFENVVGGSGSDTLSGNSANNWLIGGNGNNILVGLAGDDILQSGTGRDLLIGGLGADVLNAGAGTDILIAGRTTNDTNATNLNTLRAEWISANPYVARVSNLRAGVGNSPVSLKATINVIDDASAADVLTGGIGSDWYFGSVDDVIVDLFAGEIVEQL